MLILELVQNLRTETNGYKLNCIDNRRQNRDNLSLGKLHRTIEKYRPLFYHQQGVSFELLICDCDILFSFLLSLMEYFPIQLIVMCILRELVHFKIKKLEAPVYTAGLARVSW